MRTTLTIEDGIAAQLREIVHRSGKSFKAVVNDALRAGINPLEEHEPRPLGRG